MYIVYKLLKELVEDVSSLQSAVKDLESPQVEANPHEHLLVKTVGDTIIQQLHPLVLLYNALSSMKDVPRDCLEEKLQNLMMMGGWGLASLKVGMGASLNAGMGPHVWFRNPVNSTPQMGNLSRAPVGKDDTGLLECMKVLERTC